MLDTLVKAIHDREELSLVYCGFVRIVEPHAVGASLTGSNVLWCFQLHGESASFGGAGHYHINLGYDWCLFELAQMCNLHPTGKHFIGERLGYRRSNRHMKRIIAEL